MQLGMAKFLTGAVSKYLKKLGGCHAQAGAGVTSIWCPGPEVRLI